MKNYLKMTSAEQALGWAWLVIQLFFLPVSVVFINELLQLGLSIAVLNAVIFVIDLIAVLTIFRRYLWYQLRSIRISALILWVPVGFLLYWVLSVAVTYVMLIVQPEHINANNAAVKVLMDNRFVLTAICTVIIAPITEETLFRGLLFGQLYKKQPVLGYIVSVFVFAAVHVVSYIGQQSPLSLLISLLQYLPAGLVLSFVYTKAKTLAAPILIHATLNLLATLALR